MKGYKNISLSLFLNKLDKCSLFLKLFWWEGEVDIGSGCI